MTSLFDVMYISYTVIDNVSIEMKENLMDYSKKLKTIRDTLGLSQEALGKRLGLSGAHISRLEKGKCIVSEKILQKYMDELGVDPVWLYSEQDDGKAWFANQKVESFDTLGLRVKQLRLEMKMSQNKFADYAGVQQADINRVESGKGTLGQQSLKRIAAAFHVGVDWLQYGDETRKHYPVDDSMIAYLWENEELREMICQRMNECCGKEQK